MSKFVLEIHEPTIDAESKFNTAVEALSKALLGADLHLDHEHTGAEPTPYPALHELTTDVINEVATNITYFIRDFMRHYFNHRIGMEKSGTGAIFEFKGKTLLNPKSGKPLTVEEWNDIAADIDRIFGHIFGQSQKSIVKRAIMLGKIVQGMDRDAKTTTPLKSVETALRRTAIPAVYNKVLNYAAIHTGELIQDMTSTVRKAVANTVMDAYKNEWSTKQLEDELFDNFSDVNRDWRRIAETETATNFNNGYLMAEREAVPDGDVFMIGISGASACDWCAGEVRGKVVALLSEPPVSGDEVEIGGVVYTAIWPGKTNFGRTKRNWWVASGSQHPHCYAEGTRVMTRRGLIDFREVNEADLFISLNPDSREIEYVPAIAKVDYHYSGDMVQFESRGVDLLVTPGHSMVYSTGKVPALRFETADLLSQRSTFAIPSVGVWSGRGSSEYEQDLCEFFGWYVSEGSVVTRKNGACQLSIAQEKLNNQSRISGCLTRLGVKHFVGKQAITMYGDFARYILSFNLGKSYEKQVPEFIQFLDSNAIQRFLDAFCLGDGSRRVRDCFGSQSEEVVYYTSSLKLVSDLCLLISKVGKAPVLTLHSKAGTVTKHSNGKYVQRHDLYKVSESRAQNRSFRAETKSEVSIIPYTGQVYCVELLKNNTLWVERNGKLSWSGNCRCTWQRYNPEHKKYYDSLMADLEAARAAGVAH